jgi:hypothetical protein
MTMKKNKLYAQILKNLHKMLSEWDDFTPITNNFQTLNLSKS